MRQERRNNIMALAVLLLTFAWTAGVSGQQDSLPGNIIDRKSVENSLVDERVLLETDREIYLCGEYIYFTAFTYEGNWFLPVSLSSVLYLELYNSDYRVFSKGKFNIMNGRSAGKILIPRTISTGYYYLRAYTNYMKNFGDRQFFITRVKIVNPFYEYYPDSAKLPAGESLLVYTDITSIRRFPVPPPGKAIITTENGKKNFGNREEVKIVIHAYDNEDKPVKVDLSVFVTLSDNRIEDTISFFEKEILAKERERPVNSASIPVKNKFSALKYLPEIRGDILSGKLLYRDKKPAGGIEVLQSFTGKSACVESCITGKDGSFFFLADDDMNMGDLILKALKPEKEVVVILDDEFYQGFTLHRKEVLHLTAEETELVKKQFINIQVDDAFTADTLSTHSETFPVPDAFYGDSYTEYRFSDYAKLPNMTEFIFEIIQGVVLAKENKQEVLNILDDKAISKIGTDPLIIIDGVPVSEASAVTGLDPGKVQYVRVVRDKYIFRRKIFDGILDIITYSGDASSFSLSGGTFRFDFMRTERSSSEIMTPRSLDAGGTIPVYKNILLNIPLISAGDDGKAEISFLTPDNSGSYIIRCLGLTPEGIPIEGSAVINVGDNK